MRYRFLHKKYVKDHQFEEAYTMLVNEGKHDYLFYDGGINDLDGFLQWMRKDMNWSVLGYDENGQLVGFFWLNGFQGKAAQYHFAIFNNVDKIELATRAVQWLKNLNVFDSVYGLTPKPYFRVMKLFKAVGFEVSGELPGACYLSKHGRHVPGIISVLDFNKI